MAISKLSFIENSGLTEPDVTDGRNCYCAVHTVLQKFKILHLYWWKVISQGFWV